MTNRITTPPKARTVIVGVDTHTHVHVAVAIDSWGIRLGSRLPYDSPAGDDRQINSEDRRSVKLRVRPPLTGTHRCH